MNRPIVRWIVAAFVIIAIAVAGWLLFSPSGSEQERLRVALFKAPASEALRSMALEFERQTGAAVDIEVLGYADLQTRIEQQGLQQSGGSYDVIMVDSILIPGYARNGIIQPIGDVLTQDGNYRSGDLIPALADYLGRYPAGGQVYGVPFMSNTHMMAYRPATVEPVARRLGLELPGMTQDSAWTWEEYSRVATAITADRRRGNSGPYGTSLQARAGAWLVYEWYSVLFGFDQDAAARRTGLPDFRSSGARAADFYANLYRQTAPDALNWGHEEETGAMCSGQTAMDATSNVELAAGLRQPACQGGPDAMRFAFPPRGASGRSSPDMGGYGLFVARGASNRELAVQFLKWATSPQVHRRIVLNGGSPIRTSQLDDPEILQRFPYLEFYGELIGTSVYRARVPNWPEMQDVISRELGGVMLGRRQSTEAMAAVQAWVERNRIQ